MKRQGTAKDLTIALDVLTKSGESHLASADAEGMPSQFTVRFGILPLENMNKLRGYVRLGEGAERRTTSFAGIDNPFRELATGEGVLEPWKGRLVLATYGETVLFPGQPIENRTNLVATLEFK